MPAPPCTKRALLIALIVIVFCSVLQYRTEKNESPKLQESGARDKTDTGVVMLQTSTTSSRTETDGPSIGVLYIFDKHSLVGPGTYGNASVALAKYWADRYGYQLFFDQERAPEGRALEWGKVIAIQKHLPLVDYLIVLDYDVFIVDPMRTAMDVLHSNAADCVQFFSNAQPEASNFFAWISRGYEDHFDDQVIYAKRKYPLNAGFLGFKNDPMTFKFLNETWKQGDAFNHYLAWHFPKEQAAMEDIGANDEYVKNICVLPQDKFSMITMESAENALAHDNVFAWHVTGWDGPLQKRGSTKFKRRMELSQAACKKVSELVGQDSVCY